MACLVHTSQWFGRWTRQTGYKRFDKFLDTVVQEHMDDVQIKSEDEKDFVDVLLSVQKENVAAGLSIDRVTIKATVLVLYLTFSLLRSLILMLLYN